MSPRSNAADLACVKLAKGELRCEFWGDCDQPARDLVHLASQPKGGRMCRAHHDAVLGVVSKMIERKEI